jgi:hypothetical protein
VNHKIHYLSAAEEAHALSLKARSALTRGNKEGAVAYVTVAHTYALMADADITLPQGGGLEFLPSIVSPIPAQRPPAESSAPVADPQEPKPERSTNTEGTPHDAPSESAGDEDSAVPLLLLRAHRAVVEAGGAMYGIDLASALGVRAQQLGKDMIKILQAVNMTRPKNGTVSPTPGAPFRNGYTAETLAAAIAAYRVRAQLAAA